jgi:hypothetical protein
VVSTAEAYGRLLPDATLVSVMHVFLGIGGDEDSRRALEAAVERARVAGDEFTVAILERAAPETNPATVRARVEDVLGTVR